MKETGDCILQDNHALTRALIQHFWRMQFNPAKQKKINKKKSKSKKQTRELFR